MPRGRYDPSGTYKITYSRGNSLEWPLLVWLVTGESTSESHRIEPLYYEWDSLEQVSGLPLFPRDGTKFLSKVR